MSRLSNPPAVDEYNDNSRESSVAWLLPWHWPIGIWILLIAGFLMVLPFGIRALMLSWIPEMQDPFDVKEFVKWDVPESEDAFTYYNRAATMRQQLSATPLVNPAEKVNAVFENGWAAADDLTREWLEKHHKAMEVWKQGTAKNRGMNLPPDKLNYSSILTTVHEQREFVRLARLEAERCISEGQLEESWSWLRASFRSAGHTSHRGCLIQELVAVAIHTTTSAGMVRWAEHPGVTSDQLKAALADVQSDYSLYERYSNSLKSEFLAARNTLQSKQWIQFAGQGPNTTTNPNLQSAMRMAYWVMGEPELTVRVFRQVLANQIQEVDKPLAERRQMTGSGIAMLFDHDPAVGLRKGQLPPAVIDQALRRSSLSRTLMPAIRNVDKPISRLAARQAVLQVLLAAQAYRRDHAEFPEDLSVLVPDYLPLFPMDPGNAAGGSVNYRRDEPTKAVVWCVGEDGVDNNGSIETPTNRPADVGFPLK